MIQVYPPTGLGPPTVVGYREVPQTSQSAAYTNILSGSNLLHPSADSRGALLSYSVGLDPAFSSVVFLCHFDGTDGDSTATNVVQALGRGNTIGGGATRQIDTAQALFGTASAWINNTTSQWWTSGTHADYALGSGDFTIEFACRTPSLAADIVFDMRPGGIEGAYPALSINASGNLFYYVSSATRITGTSVLTTNTWHRIAVSRVSGTTRMFVDGTQVGSNWTDSTTYLQSAIVLGASSFSIGQTPWNGWIDEVRITKGVGRYSANYTVATEAFPDS